MMMMMMITD